MTTNQDYYQILGISKNASEAEIKSAYRKLALQWHPDRNKAAGATEKFKEINEAYEVLSDPQKKAAYDQFGHAAFQQGGMGGPGEPFAGGTYQQGPFSYTYRTYTGGGAGSPFEGFEFGGFTDPFELFEQFFGGGFTAAAQRRARRATYSLGLTFMEAAAGTEKTVEVGGKQMKIKIPAGVDDGTRVRFGDFDVVISVWPDENFERDGLDIYTDAKVDFILAILGTTVDVSTVDGPVNLKIQPGTQPDTVIRLRGRGIREERTNRVGDQYVRVKVQIPTRLSREQKSLLEELRSTISSEKRKSGWF